METVTENPNVRGDAAQRVRAYLEFLGIDNGPAIEQISKQILQMPGQRENDDNSAAMDEIIRRKGLWYNALNEYSAKSNSPSPNPLVAHQLRMVLHKNPDAFIGQPGPELLADVGELPIFPATPTPHEGQMPSQPLGQLPVGLQKVFWQTAILKIKSILSKVMYLF
jgi:hypothetical protein